MSQQGLTSAQRRTAVGPWSDLALHTMGWRAFQDLCSQICEVILQRPVEIFREAQDGGQDAVFLIPDSGGIAVGTVQCKHVSDHARALRFSDLTPEIEHVQELIRLGQADTYVLITNMSVDAPVAMEIRAALIRLGVRKAHVLGKQYIVRTIKASPRLRALIPQVYGLGDLTALLDERLSQQSRALLDHWIPKLKTYVSTRSHRRAVRSLGDHGIVLLLGNPSAGKSTIGAILSTIASENPNHTVLALTSPHDFEATWNPNDPGRFFWIDDAFGSNVMREDYVQDWASAFRKVQAAISSGNKFLLTSRLHIYEAAKRRLGQRNLQVFIDDRAVVNVGALTVAERAQILYNHVNYGQQSQQWKTAVKPFLEAVAATPNFLPGIAERLGDPNFTKGLVLRENALVQFMEQPREHLVDTLNALDDESRAALLLVYVHQGALDPGAPEATAAQAVTDLTGVPLAQILDRFSDLQGSFLRKPGPGERAWTFAHPTIADALTVILRQKSHMVPALLRGATIDTILSGFTSEGVTTFLRDAMVIPGNLNAQLVRRLVATPDEPLRNWALFAFLAYRVSDEVVQLIVEAAPEILDRQTWSSDQLNNDPRINAFARVNRLGFLPDERREEAAGELERAALRCDLSFLEDSRILALIPVRRLIALGIKLRGQVLPAIQDEISSISAEADLDGEPEDYFDNVRTALHQLEQMADDSVAANLLSSARHQIDESVKILLEKKEELGQEKGTVDWGDLVSPGALAAEPTPVSRPKARPRSIFDDVDQN